MNYNFTHNINTPAILDTHHSNVYVMYSYTLLYALNRLSQMLVGINPACRVPLLPPAVGFSPSAFHGLSFPQYTNALNQLMLVPWAVHCQTNGVSCGSYCCAAALPAGDGEGNVTFSFLAIGPFQTPE
jgi:hypothetical protein